MGVTLPKLTHALFGTALFLFLLLVARPALAERMVFHNIFQNNKAIEHQLSGINHIVQDQQGFMWFGSEKGLARYDGNDTRVYRHDPKDPFSIAHDFIRGLLIDRQGIVWVATEAGLCYYQARLDRFSCGGEHDGNLWPREEIRAIVLDHDDNLYFGTTSSLYRVEKDRSRFSQVSIDLSAEGSTASTGVTSLAVDAQNALWIGTDGRGLISVDSGGKLLQHFLADSGHSNTLVHNRISALALDQLNRLWVGTYGGGISMLNPERTGFNNYVYSGGQHGTLSSNIIWDIFSDSFNNIWIAVDQGGLVRFDEGKGFVATRHKPYDATSLTSDQVRAIYEDSNGDLWLGAFPSGVSFHNRSTGRIRSFKHEPDNPQSLSHSAILTIHQDANSDIWIGTEDGLNLFNQADGAFTRYQFGAGSALTAKAVLSIEQYDKDTLWVGTWSGGLLAFHLNERRFSPIDTGRLSGTGKNSMFIWDITRGRNGNMWIGTEFEGAARYDRTLKKLRFFSRDAKNADGMPGNFVWDVLEDQRGTIWMATNSGLAILPPDQDEPVRIKRGQSDRGGLLADRIVALFEDSRGRVWIGTQDNGTFVYHPTSHQFQHIGVRQGLPPGISSGFTEDAQGNIWILTTNGLVKADADHFDLQVFGTENGLAGNSFNRDAALRTSAGLLYIGSADGLSIFNPEEIGDDLREFPVLITALRILNEEVKAGAEASPLDHAINFTRHLKLGHRDSMFSFDFAALDYRHSQDIRYAYMLEGFDQNWNDIGTRRSATYTNIPRGEYVFRVKASRGKRSWTESEGLHIVITPAPWHSWWAYLSYALAASIVGYFLLHYFQLRGHTQLYKTLSSTDALTGAANRTGIIQAAQALFSDTEARSNCLMFIDIDHFKRVNDTRGHDSGDRVLVEVAQALRCCLRRSDLLGRWGGEEFLLIYTNVDEADGLRLAENIRREVAGRLFDRENSPLKVTLSMGCAFIQSGEHFESAVKRADLALYRAKNAGRNCVVFAD